MWISSAVPFKVPVNLILPGNKIKPLCAFSAFSRLLNWVELSFKVSPAIKPIDATELSGWLFKNVAIFVCVSTKFVPEGLLLLL